MKIAISAQNEKKDCNLDSRFGRCSHFHIYDLDNSSVEIFENQGQKASGGAGIAAAQQIIDLKVEAVITGSLGPNAFKLIDKAGIKSYTSDEFKIEEVLEKYKAKELKEIEIPGKSHHGMGM